MLYNPPSFSTDPNASYVGKDVAAGRQGSRLPPTVPEGTQREIVALITAAQAMGLDAPTNSDLKQMLKAVRSGLLGRFPATGTPDAIAISPQPPYLALVEGLRFRFKVPGTAGAANTTTAPTFVVNGLAPVSILRRDGAALVKADLTAGRVIEIEIDAGLNARLVSAAPSESLLAILPYTQAGATYAGAFTAGARLIDFPGGATSGFSGPFTVAQSLTITGATYAVISGSCGFRMTSGTAADCRARFRTTVQGGSPVVSQRYQGCRPYMDGQPTVNVNQPMQNLDPTKSLLIELIVDRTETTGTVIVNDPRIDAQHNGNA